MYLGAIILGTGGSCFTFIGVTLLLCDKMDCGWMFIAGGIAAFILASITAVPEYIRNKKQAHLKGKKK